MIDDFKISISKQQIAELPKVTFSGEISIIDDEENADKAVSLLEQEKVIGFDTETRPSFTKGKANKVALMQLSTLDRCYLFRLNKLGICASLRRLLENQDVVKIGLSVHDDFNVMHRSSTVEPKGFVELQQMVKDYHIADISLQKIFAILFDHKISKSQRLSNWETVTLSPQQQLYAATDAWACLKIFNFLKDGCFCPEKSVYIVHEEDEQDVSTAQDKQNDCESTQMQDKKAEKL